MSASSSPSAPGYAAWRDRVERELGDADFDAELVTHLPEGLAVEPLYLDHPADGRQPRKANPGELGWHLTPRCEAALPEDANEQIRADLEGGASALWLRFDLAARTGVDADDLAAGRLAGREGLAAHHLGDVDAALAGVELDAVPLLVDAGSNALPVAATLLALVESRGLDCGAAELHLGCDPLAALASDGRVPASFANLQVEMRQLTSFCHARLPEATALAVSDLPYNAAGGTASDELGMAAATLVEYLRWLASAGWDPELAAPHILLRSAVDRDVFAGHRQAARAARALGQDRPRRRRRGAAAGPHPRRHLGPLPRCERPLGQHAARHDPDLRGGRGGRRLRHDLGVGSHLGRPDISRPPARRATPNRSSASRALSVAWPTQPAARTTSKR